MKTRTRFLSLSILFSVLLGCTPLTTRLTQPTPTAATAHSQFVTATPLSSSSPTATPTLEKTSPPLSTATPPPVAPSAAPTPEEANAIRQLTQIQLPNRDLNDLARRFKGALSATPTPPATGAFNLGDKEIFWVLDSGVEPPRQFQITTTLQYRTNHSYWWVQDGFAIPEADIAASAQAFEENIYPTDRRFFGSEWSPGVDDDVRVHIVMGDVPGVAGYYSAANEYSRAAVPYSNQREMFLINLKAIQPGQPQFNSVLAHEFQHMIHWNLDPNEDSWVNEGLSELAKFLAGYGQSSFLPAYLQNPDLQLTSWGQEDYERRANYGASFLFALYLYDRFGAEMIHRLVEQPENGIAGIEKTLQDLGYENSFDQLFADFIIANYLNDPSLAEGQWGYSPQAVDLPTPKLAASFADFPVEAAEQVKQYGVDYIELSPKVPLSIAFSGPITASLLNNKAYSGTYQWYGNRGDNSDTTLTRLFDLRSLKEAALEFWAWYDIEPDWDYAYVTVSTDGGASWDILPATSTVNTNPSGNAYGPGFTGASGGWLKERVDLSAYVGQEILLRFEYITDDAVNHPGFAVDNISIPQLGYVDDVEQGDGGWQAEGFFRTDNILPQRFTVQLIEFDAGGKTSVNQMPLDENNSGQYALDTSGGTVPRRIILVISAQAPLTTEAARYSLSVAQN